MVPPLHNEQICDMIAAVPRWRWLMSTVMEKTKDVWGKISSVIKKIEEVIGVICRCIFKLRKIFMAVPVVYLAIQLANANMERLPEAVGLNLQSTGEFALTVTREYAVYGPLGVTAFCLMLMFFSRKAFYPWVISIFSLVLPYLIYFSNLYPA